MSLPDTGRLTQIGRWLFGLNAAVWVIFGVWSLMRIGNGAPGDMVIPWLIVILMLGNVIAFLWCSWALKKQAAWYRFAAIVVLAVNILLTFTDQFGIFDFLTLLLDLILLGIVLILHRRRGRHWL